jgi:ATP-dependent DNA helicase RecG
VLIKAREQIIQLGKLLAEEQRQGYQDQVVDGGLDQFLISWRVASDDALENPAVREALALLDAYGAQSPAMRQQRLDHALNSLRDLFRTRSEPAESAGVPVRKRTAPRQPLPADEAIALDTPIAKLPDVRRNTAAAFKRLGLQQVIDLLYHFPHRYDDYSSQKQIADLQVGAVETVVVKVRDARTFSMKNGRNAIEVQVYDESGFLKVVFFGGSHWMLKQFPFGRKLVLSGKVTTFQGVRQMNNPDWEPFSEDELIHTGRLVPVHPLTKGLHERNARTLIKLAVDYAAPLLEDHLPPVVRERCGLLPLAEAIAQVHFPDSYELLQRARTRLGFDEFLLIQLGVVQRRLRWQGEMGYPLTLKRDVHADFLNQLPFTLTGTPAPEQEYAAPPEREGTPEWVAHETVAGRLLPIEDGTQVQTLKEIFTDLQHPTPMARLLQGDVGSGKTAVAAAALLQAIANGFQAALMAPTEILAEQHFKGLCNLLGQVRVPRDEQQAARAQNNDDWRENLSPEEQERLEKYKRQLGLLPEDGLSGDGVRVALLTGSLGAKERRRVLEAVEKGEVDLIIGTHALITEGVKYHSLGMVCIDEQHRFGVEQRERLKQKGFNPHLLVMTATPIPRTLTLTIYGELDTSIINKLPPGRQEIRTRWITRAERYKAYKHMRKEVEQGRQVFVICPLVEESEKVDLPSAEEMHEQLQHEFADMRVGLIHGRLLSREKDVVMRAFRDHEFDILVATAVVEVGIDIPNASTIIIEGAERFGLAQLHQFRGRVGRGAHKSYCILVSDVENEVTTQRLEAMENTRDGFELAEIDLQLRGPGEFFGKRQSGTPDLKIARLADTALLVSARREAQAILADDSELAQPEHTLLRRKMQEFWANVEGAS